jgi:hypothetical protein
MYTMSLTIIASDDTSSKERGSALTEATAAKTSRNELTDRRTTVSYAAITAATITTTIPIEAAAAFTATSVVVAVVEAVEAAWLLGSHSVINTV